MSSQAKMRNRFLREGALSIPYYPALRLYCGSIGATVLMQQCDFLFGSSTKSGKKFEDGFYKFLEPVSQHEKYVAGDSWTEVLSVTPDEFRTLFDKIGTRYSSLTAYRQAEESGDPFKDKFYLSFVDRKTNLTWYVRNHEKVDALLDFVFNQNISQPIDSKAPVKSHLQEMANPIYTAGKPHLQSWQKPVPELANTHLHNTEITTEITKAEAAAASLNEILVLQNEQDKILLASLIEKFGVEKIGACAMELIKKGKRPYLSSIQIMLVATEKKEGQAVALKSKVDIWNSSATPVDPNRKEKMAQLKAKIRDQLAST